MAAPEVEVSIDGDTIEVDGLTVQDGDAAAFLEEQDPAGRPTLVARAFEVGMTAMRLSQTAVDVEFVQRKFEEMASEFEAEVATVEERLEETIGENGRLDDQLATYLEDGGELETRLETAFGEDGVLEERLDAELGEDGERIQAALDPSVEGTPTHALKQEIQALRDSISEEQGAQSVIEQTALKGEKFEDTVEGILGRAASQTSDSFAFTGETVGEIPDAKTGDFVYELGGTDKRIVIEAKTEGYSLDKIQSEMERAIENRDADYGIFVVDSLANLPRTKVGWFNEFDRDYVSVALSESGEDLEPAFLRFALQWATVRALHDVGTDASDIDTTQIQTEIDAVDDRIDRFSQVREQCTSIENSVTTIRDELNDIETDIETRLEALQTELSKAE